MEEELGSWRQNAAALGLVAQHLYMFAGALVAYGLRNRLDEARLAEIRAHAVLNLKNVGALGFPIEEEAAILGHEIQQFEELIGAAIDEGREAKET